MTRKQRSARLWRRSDRDGLVTVEFAIMTPIIFLIFLGSLEIAQLNFTRNMCNDAAYQVARLAIVPGANIDEAKADAIQLLNESGLTVVEMDVVESVDSIEVIVTAPIDPNSWGIGRFTRGLVIEEACEMRKQVKTQANN